MTSGLSGQAKLAAVSQLLEVLNADISDGALSDDDRAAKLEQLKVHGRDPRNADPIFTPENVELLCRYAFGDQSLKTSREALKCLANTFLLRPKLSETFVNEDYGVKAAERLKSDEDEDEFLICRILFLTTYGSKLDFPTLVEKHELASSISSHLSRHATLIRSRPLRKISVPMEELALSENLKLIYNVTHHHPGTIKPFSECLESILDILSNIDIPRPPLHPPITFLINALSQLDLQQETLPSEPILNTHIDKLVSLLDQATAQHSPSDLESLSVPLILFLRKVYLDTSSATQKHIQALLLPTSSDRDLPIGQSDTLSSRLLRRTTNPATPNLRESISDLYFILSSRDPTTFIQNIGYGYASGYLSTHNISYDSTTAPSTATTTETSGSVPINPVTGQRLDREPDIDPSAGMSTEDKEREAERLFVLFERLRATGVVNVENPVAQAMREGRVEELSDSDDED